jgi:uncharacterized membrane protein
MRNNKNRKPSRRDNFSRQPETIENILPSSEILEKFEDAVPGSVADLIEMAKIEQKHRHDWQEKYLKSHNISTRIGQICGLVYNIILLGVVYNLINSGEKELAMNLFTINAVVIAFVVIVTTFERRVFSRRPRVRGREDRRNSNQQRNNSPKRTS